MAAEPGHFVSSFISRLAAAAATIAAFVEDALYAEAVVFAIKAQEVIRPSAEAEAVSLQVMMQSNVLQGRATDSFSRE